jgi:peptidoglycan/xylan/chitin deacetylase (PgdA/CDA1 family)
VNLIRASRRTAFALLTLVVASATLVGCGSAKQTPPPQPAASAPTSTPTAAVPPTSAPVAKPSAPESSTMAPAPADTLQPPSYDGYEPLPIFTYHQVNPKVGSDITISPADFEAQLKLLKSMGYETISARQLAEYHDNGTPLPPKPVMITFDDGWKDQYTYAAPLLEKYGFTGVFFIYPKMIGNGGAFLTKDMVVSLDKRGFDIESHTWGHVSLVRKPGTSFRSFERWTRPQFTQTDAWTEKVIGKKSVALAYPYGFYDLETVGILMGNGMKLGFTVDEGVADARPWDRLALKRFTVYRGRSLAEFKRRLTSTPLPATNIQPPPGSRVRGHDTSLTVDITALPADVKGIEFASGNSIGKTAVVRRGGKRYAVSQLSGAKSGFRNVTLRGIGAADKKYITAWGLVMGD